MTNSVLSTKATTVAKKSKEIPYDMLSLFVPFAAFAVMGVLAGFLSFTFLASWGVNGYVLIALTLGSAMAAYLSTYYVLGKLDTKQFIRRMREI